MKHLSIHFRFSSNPAIQSWERVWSTRYFVFSKKTSRMTRRNRKAGSSLTADPLRSGSSAIQGFTFTPSNSLPPTSSSCTGVHGWNGVWRVQKIIQTKVIPRLKFWLCGRVSFRWPPTSDILRAENSFPPPVSWSKVWPVKRTTCWSRKRSTFWTKCCATDPRSASRAPFPAKLATSLKNYFVKQNQFRSQSSKFPCHFQDLEATKLNWTLKMMITKALWKRLQVLAPFRASFYSTWRPAPSWCARRSAAARATAVPAIQV